MDKYINRLIENPWFLRIVALVIAILLFENVSEEKMSSVVNVPQDQEAETIEDVPVKLFYDTDALVVTGVPETVTISLTGPKATIQQTKIQRNFEVYVDLTAAEIGTQNVPIQIQNISDKLKVTIEPSSVKVSVQEKVTEEFSVEAEFNSDILAEGYVSEKAVVAPNTVKITGAKDVVDKITYVKATVDVKGPIMSTITRSSDILVFDRELNKLNVEIEPKEVTITVPVKALTKTVPINLIQLGTPLDNITIESISLEKEEVTIIASEEVLNKIDSVDVIVDISNIEKNLIVPLPVIIPEEVVSVDPALVDVSIQVKKTEEKKLTNIPIEIKGLAEQYSVVFADPENGAVDLTMIGEKETLNGLTAADFIMSIDVGSLAEGEHDVEIKADGPENVEWKLEKNTAKISIILKEV